VIVADTHAWIWWITQPRLLSPAAANAMSNGFGIAAISCWEVAMLADKRRIELDIETLEWLRQAIAIPGTTLLALNIEIAARAGSLPPDVGGDPADRLIVATAIERGAALVTKDERIRWADIVPTIW
jgi:PIN domain nuclease of toxin-antitoxin system